MAKREIEVVVTGKNALGPATDAAGKDAEKLQKKLQKLNEISGPLGEKLGIGKLGKALGGDDEALGGAGKVAGALAIAEGAGRILQGVGDKLTKVNADANEMNATAGEFVGELARSIPVIGTVAVGFDKIGSGLRDTAATALRMVGAGEGWARWMESGEAALARANKEAEEVLKRSEQVKANIAAIQGTRTKLTGITDQNTTRTPADEIAKKRDADLADIDSQRDILRAKSRNGKIAQEDEENLAAATAAVKKHAADELAKLTDAAYTTELQKRQAHAAEMLQADQQAAGEEASARSAQLRLEGKDYEAALEDQRATYRDQLQKLADDQAKLRGETGLTPGERDARQAKLDQRGAAIQGQNTTAEAALAKSEDERKLSVAEKLQKIQHDTAIDSVDANDVEGQKLVKRLQIVEDIAAKEKELTELLKDPTLKDSQLEAIEAQLDALDKLKDQRLAAVGQRKDLAVQGQGSATAVDGRFGGAAMAQESARVEVMKDQAKDTKTAAINSKAIRDTLEKLLEEFQASPSV